MENGLSLLGQAGSPAVWLFTLLFAARCPSLMNAGLAAFGAGLPRAWGRPGYAGGFVAATVRRPKGRWHGPYAVPYPGDCVFFGASLAKCWGRRRDFARCKSRKAPPGSSWGSQRPNQGAEGLVRQRAALEVWKGANSLKGFWCAAFWCHCASACRFRDVMSATCVYSFLSFLSFIFLAGPSMRGTSLSQLLSLHIESQALLVLRMVGPRETTSYFP